MRPFFLFGHVLLGACGHSAEKQNTDTVEPLDLPADTAESGVPVGVQTVKMGDLLVEVWYPATAATADMSGEVADLMQFIPQSFIDHVGDFTIEGYQTAAVRDAAVRLAEDSYPVIVFSHGFGGFRLQSTDLTVHLASRGYVVMATDHVGRRLTDALPCLISPPLDGCDLSGFYDDAANTDVPAMLDLVASDELPLAIRSVVDPDVLGMIGHSAGAASTSSVGAEDERLLALLPMAGGSAVSRDVPTAFFNGTCDAYTTSSGMQSVADHSGQGQLFELVGAGHLAFTNLCDAGFDDLAADLLEGRDDLNTTIYEMLVGLATDGCQGYSPAVDSDDCLKAYLDMSTAHRSMRGAATAFFDLHLKSQGDGVDIDGDSFLVSETGN